MGSSIPATDMEGAQLFIALVGLLFSTTLGAINADDAFSPSSTDTGFQPSEFQMILERFSANEQFTSPSEAVFDLTQASLDSEMATVRRHPVINPKRHVPMYSPSLELELSRAPRQSAAESVNGGIDFSQATRTEDGRLCVIKEAKVETVSKDPILVCKHKEVEKCHYTYLTYFKPAQEETCEENFEKKCQITFKQEAIKERVRKCYRPVEKVCNGQGPEECKTIYESSCTTKYIKQGPGKFVGDTRCEKLPVKICGAGCVTEEGPEECHDKTVDSLVDVPEETCDLNPQKTCRLVTRLVPSLKPKQECTTVPQETCSLKFSQPKRQQKPLRTEWCLDDQPEDDQPQYSAPTANEYSSGGQARTGKTFAFSPTRFNG